MLPIIGVRANYPPVSGMMVAPLRFARENMATDWSKARIVFSRLTKTRICVHVMSFDLNKFNLESQFFSKRPPSLIANLRQDFPDE
ncbi:hypothetical protein Y032_0171g318 [Ancylostoma ceylanicum]|uniref:Uncharacterized protein n=1 Tax=Ancylostoma ceylanicum TaxID=53326 RepID=A0A016SVE6_9BILA|nr:hypothetical protein Y032_0171g318 [Ancylostoma ceylanicum]